MIRIAGLQKWFGDVHAVRGVDLEVQAGQLLVLLGQNGAGKSTTLRCAGGILRPDAGRITFGKLALPGDLDAVRRRLGVVTDQARLYGRTTALEYLDHFGRLYGVPEPERSRRIGELLERFELVEDLRKPLATFSRGMAQKVALIRSTLHRPDWIFCDEPTSGLDPVAAADMRVYLAEQRDRGAALVVTTHILSEAELMADRLTVMRAGRLVAEGTLDELRQEALPRRRLHARVAGEAPAAVLEWLRSEGVGVERAQGNLDLDLPEGWDDARAATLAAGLQARLDRAGTPFYRLEEEPASLERIYLRAMARAAEPDGEVPPPPAAERSEGIPARAMVSSLAEQPHLLRHLLPFYLSSWWRRGDLPWVLTLNGFVLLLVAGASLFGSLPGTGSFTARLGRSSLDAGLLLPLFFMSFALMESIKTSIGIWWEKAQNSLEVLLYVPLRDPALVWMEVLPGAVVSACWIGLWMTVGMVMLALFGRPAPWALLPVFVLVAVATAYWAAMGRMLGFLLFPREGAAGGAWSFLLSPVSAAVADIPLGLFVIRSPVAPASLALPFAACLALTILTAASFDRERLLDSGLTRPPRRRRRSLPAMRPLLAGLAATSLLAVVGAAFAAGTGSHSWAAIQDVVAGRPLPSSVAAFTPPSIHLHGGVNVAAAGLAGIVAALALALVLLTINFAAFFLLGLPEVLALGAAALLWGMQAGFGATAALAGWLGVGGGIVLLALALNTGAALPIYSALVFGAGRRLDRLRAAWADYFTIYRRVVLPCCALFGLVVVGLLLVG
jgi:ABC-2 type transport system ATP-binding protein